MTRDVSSAAPSAETLEALERQVATELAAGLSDADRDALGLAVHDLPGGFLLTFARYPQVLDFNRTINLGVTDAATAATLDLVRERARAVGVPEILVGLVPGAQPADLRDQLLALGARPARAWMVLWRPATSMASLSPEVEVHPVTTGEYGTFSDVMLRGLGMPPDMAPMTRAVNGRPGWTNYLAWVDGQPVASSSLYVTGGYAWLGNATTLPEWRRHGAQSALIARRISDAARQGAHTVYTQVAEDLAQSPNPSEHNMRRAGFLTAYRREHVILPSAAMP